MSFTGNWFLTRCQDNSIGERTDSLTGSAGTTGLPHAKWTELEAYYMPYTQINLKGTRP